MNSVTVPAQHVNHRMREVMINEIIEHEEMCGMCSDEGLNQIEKHLRLMDNTSLAIEYKNYFPAA